jgi:hypothetical protein
LATINLSARGASSITVALAADAGETSWEIEVNREPDFSADESYFIAVDAGGDVPIPDLVPDTPYYFRARKTNASNGPWGATLMGSTTAPAAPLVPAYNGFSIIPAIVVVPEPIADLVATNVADGSDALNLLNDDPMSVFHTVGASAITFRTTGRPVDTIAILGTLANEDVTWRIRAAATFAGVTGAPGVDTGVVQFRVNPGIGRRQHYHAFRRLAAVYDYEYWRIDIAGIEENFIARNLVIGFARSSVNISKGAGIDAADGGTMNRTQFGQPDRVRGWRGRRVEFPLSWISEAEFETKWRDLHQLVGTTDPVLALPNPKVSRYLNDRIAYGDIVTARDEHVASNKYNKTLEIRSLY